MVANCMVRLVAAGRELHTDCLRQESSSNSRFKCVTGVVAMCILGEARLAQIKIFTGLAVEKFRLGMLCSRTC